MNKHYYRPIVMTDAARPQGAVPVAGGWAWFQQVEVLRRDAPGEIVPVCDLNPDVVARISRPRKALKGIGFERPSIMGVLNVTPDSFSDGGQFNSLDAAMQQAEMMMAQGAMIIDIGGESTRPGAKTVDIKEEISRVVPTIHALRSRSKVAISIDTRKSAVAQAAIKAGATIVNDVSGFTFDADLKTVVAAHDVGVCLMHTQGPPETMQDRPTYSNILLDVYDFLEQQIMVAENAGISRDRIMIDPGIGFGKTVDHCLALIAGIGLFHGLGCPILLGVSRKSFIGHITGQEMAQNRVFGSVSVAMMALSHGVQVFRVHDIEAHADAFKLSTAIQG